MAFHTILYACVGSCRSVSHIRAEKISQILDASEPLVATELGVSERATPQRHKQPAETPMLSAQVHGENRRTSGSSGQCKGVSLACFRKTRPMRDLSLCTSGCIRGFRHRHKN